MPRFTAQLPLRLVVALSALIAACSSGAPASTTPPPAETAEATEPPPPLRTAGEIARADLIPVLDAGLGRFLGGVGVEPHLVEGGFAGWRLLRLFPEDTRFRGIDIGPGDIVTSINGQAIERPEQAFAVWNGLRVASELMVAYTRDGEDRQLRFAIVD